MTRSAQRAGGEQIRDLLRRMLTVAVALHHGVVAVFHRVAKPGAERAPDSQVHRQAKHARARLAGECRGVVGRCIVDDKAVEGRRRWTRSTTSMMVAASLCAGTTTSTRRPGRVVHAPCWCSTSSTNRASSSAWASTRSRTCDCRPDTLMLSWMAMVTSTIGGDREQHAGGRHPGEIAEGPHETREDARRARRTARSASQPSAYRVVTRR